ncbi:putative Transposable element Tc1 transposase-like 52, partial [Homarus americanus]
MGAVCKLLSRGLVVFLRFVLCFCLNISVMGSGTELGRDTIVAIITLYKEGYKCKDIATRVGIGVRQVQKWIKKFRDGGGEDIPTPKPRSGRPRKIQNRTSKVIKRQLDKNPTLTARKLKENNPALVQDVSVRCISDHLLKDLQYRSCCAKVLPLLSAKNVRDRIAFSKKYKDWTLEDWEQVLWSDESMFVVSSGCRSKRKNWQDASHNVWRRSSSLEENRLAN